MIVCVKCRKEMLCDKNDVGCRFGSAHVYCSDRFKCPKCGIEICNTNPKPIFDPDGTAQDEYVQMDETGDGE